MITKISYYGDETADFHARKILEAGSNYIWWSIILIDSILKKGENYYPQVSLKECKYIEKEKMLIKYITDDLKYCFGESHYSDEE